MSGKALAAGSLRDYRRLRLQYEIFRQLRWPDRGAFDSPFSVARVSRIKSLIKRSCSQILDREFAEETTLGKLGARRIMSVNFVPELFQFELFPRL